MSVVLGGGGAEGCSSDSVKRLTPAVWERLVGVDTSINVSDKTISVALHVHVHVHIII